MKKIIKYFICLLFATSCSIINNNKNDYLPNESNKNEIDYSTKEDSFEKIDNDKDENELNENKINQYTFESLTIYPNSAIINNAKYKIEAILKAKDVTILIDGLKLITTPSCIINNDLFVYRVVPTHIEGDARDFYERYQGAKEIEIYDTYDASKIVDIVPLSGLENVKSVPRNIYVYDNRIYVWQSITNYSDDDGKFIFSDGESHLYLFIYDIFGNELSKVHLDYADSYMIDNAFVSGDSIYFIMANYSGRHSLENGDDESLYDYLESGDMKLFWEKSIEKAYEMIEYNLIGLRTLYAINALTLETKEIKIERLISACVYRGGKLLLMTYEYRDEGTLYVVFYEFDPVVAAKSPIGEFIIEATPRIPPMEGISVITDPFSHAKELPGYAQYSEESDKIFFCINDGAFVWDLAENEISLLLRLENHDSFKNFSYGSNLLLASGDNGDMFFISEK